MEKIQKIQIMLDSVLSGDLTENGKGRLAVSIVEIYLPWLLTLTDSAANIIRNIYAVQDTQGGEGIDANDFRAAVDEWLEKYDG